MIIVLILQLSMFNFFFLTWLRVVVEVLKIEGKSLLEQKKVPKTKIKEKPSIKCALENENKHTKR